MQFFVNQRVSKYIKSIMTEQSIYWNFQVFQSRNWFLSITIFYELEKRYFSCVHKNNGGQKHEPDVFQTNYYLNP